MGGGRRPLPLPSPPSPTRGGSAALGLSSPVGWLHPSSSILHPSLLIIAPTRLLPPLRLSEAPPPRRRRPSPPRPGLDGTEGGRGGEEEEEERSRWTDQSGTVDNKQEPSGPPSGPPEPTRNDGGLRRVPGTAQTACGGRARWKTNEDTHTLVPLSSCLALPHFLPPPPELANSGTTGAQRETHQSGGIKEQNFSRRGETSSSSVRRGARTSVQARLHLLKQPNRTGSGSARNASLACLRP